MKDAPHKAIILLNLEIHEVDQIGLCSGNIVSSSILNKYGLSPNILLNVDGLTQEECIHKVVDLVKGLKNANN